MSTLYFDARYENTEMSVPDLPTSRKEREKWAAGLVSNWSSVRDRYPLAPTRWEKKLRQPTSLTL